MLCGALHVAPQAVMCPTACRVVVLSHQGTLGGFWRHLWFLQLDFWYLMGGGQGCGQTSPSVQGAPHQMAPAQGPLCLG